MIAELCASEVIEFRRGQLKKSPCPRCASVGGVRFRGGWAWRTYMGERHRFYYMKATCCSTVIFGRVTEKPLEPGVRQAWPSCGVATYEHINDVVCPDCKRVGSVICTAKGCRSDGTRYLSCTACEIIVRGVNVKWFGVVRRPRGVSVSPIVKLRIIKEDSNRPRRVLSRPLFHEEATLVSQWIRDIDRLGTDYCEVYDWVLANNLADMGLVLMKPNGRPFVVVDKSACEQAVLEYRAVAGRM